MNHTERPCAAVGLTLSQFRSKLYALAKLLGDVQAVTHKKPGARIPVDNVDNRWQ